MQTFMFSKIVKNPQSKATNNSVKSKAFYDITHNHKRYNFNLEFLTRA